ncbi:Transglutaminase domain protein [Olavius algarvensis associated proteobacterium Delta 3]|nr:Transglutaminase domain protein [Olavius algarvensis associated proteobacterium Delta 3]
MKTGRMTPYWLGALFFGVFFSVFFALRVDLPGRFLPNPTIQHLPAGEVVERDTWMNIIQNNRKIGYSHASLTKGDDAYLLSQTMLMRINTMGMVHEVNLTTHGRLAPDFSLISFQFMLNSGRFKFVAYGSITGNKMTVRTESTGSTRTFDIPLKRKPLLAAGLYDAVIATGLEPGREMVFHIFDPASMSQQPIQVTVIGRELWTGGTGVTPASRLLIDYKGMVQEAWIADDGEVLKQTGFLGISLIKTSREDALGGLPISASQDLTRVVSVPSNVTVPDPSRLSRMVVNIKGIRLTRLDVDGGRQQLDGTRLAIEKESLKDLPSKPPGSGPAGIDPKLLAPTPFIQSDHWQIRDLVGSIVSETDPPLEKTRKMVAWIQENIDRRPVVSMPDALATLKNRTGDCNEHAVLLAAMARAAGIPTDIDAGLVYLDGRFYYHAWNRLFLGKWITVDALLNQIPADVTHIRFSSGDLEGQLDLMDVIGKIQLDVAAMEAERS